MNALAEISESSDGDVYQQIARALEQQGYIELTDALPEAMLGALFKHFKSVSPDDFQTAGVGRELDHRVNPFVRGDQVCWLDRGDSAPAGYLDWAEKLRLGINRRLFMGLFDYECHYAYYSVGGFYKKHLDAFRGANSRVVTTVLYLTPNWQPGDGGELLLYPLNGKQPLLSIAPTWGKLVIFLSEDFPHEVSPTNRPRYSIAGWFRVNNSGVNVIDPPT